MMFLYEREDSQEKVPQQKQITMEDINLDNFRTQDKLGLK